MQLRDLPQVQTIVKNWTAMKKLSHSAIRHYRKRVCNLFQQKLSFTTTAIFNSDTFRSSFRTYEVCAAIVHCSLATPDTKQYRYIDIFPQNALRH